MRKVWAVMRREFLVRVRSRWFVITTLLAPLFMVAVVLLPELLERGAGESRQVVVIDPSRSDFGPVVARQLESTGRWFPVMIAPSFGAVQGVLDSLSSVVRRGMLDGVLVLSAQSVDSGTLEYRGRNAASPNDMRELRAAIRQALLAERLRRAGVDPQLVAEAGREFRLTTVHLAKEGSRAASGEATFVLAYILAFALYMALFIYGQSVLRSVIEEKTTRMVEVLASSMRPAQLMAGKIIGVGSVGLLQLGIWVGTAAVLYRYRSPLAVALGASDIATVEVPTMTLGSLALVLGYFVLGYFLYATLYAAVGAMVSSEQEAQQAQMPVTLLLVAAILVFPVVIDDPTSELGVSLSLVPFTAPIIMPLRWIVGSVPFHEVVASLGILAGTTALCVRLAARVYRVGLLLYGKRASLGEVLRWIRSA